MKLVYYPDPFLRKRAEALKRIDDNVRRKVGEMFEIMYEESGIGLAAPQVAWGTRLFIINVDGDPDDGDEFVYINPRITSTEGDDVDEEGCLSIPDIRAKVRRAARVVVEAQNLDGEQFVQEAEGLLARAIQHELDHLDGILFVNRLSAADKLMVQGKLKKLAKDGPPDSKKNRE